MKKAVVVLVVMLSCTLAFAEDRVIHVKVRADSEHAGNDAFRAMVGNDVIA